MVNYVDSTVYILATKGFLCAESSTRMDDPKITKISNRERRKSCICATRGFGMRRLSAAAAPPVLSSKSWSVGAARHLRPTATARTNACKNRRDHVSITGCLFVSPKVA